MNDNPKIPKWSDFKNASDRRRMPIHDVGMDKARDTEPYAEPRSKIDWKNIRFTYGPRLWYLWEIPISHFFKRFYGNRTNCNYKHPWHYNVRALFHSLFLRLARLLGLK